MNRMKRIRLGLGITQGEMAARLGLAQPTVVRWEKPGHEESGPVSKLLDLLERDLPPPASPPAPATGGPACLAGPPLSIPEAAPARAATDAPEPAAAAGAGVRPAKTPGGPDAQFSGFSHGEEA